MKQQPTRTDGTSHQDTKHQGEVWLNNVTAMCQHRKLLQQQQELRTNPGHSESNSTANQVVTQASLENANMIVGIIGGVLGIILSIFAFIKFWSWLHERLRAAQKACCSASH
jgi:hypothetical protein